MDQFYMKNMENRNSGYLPNRKAEMEFKIKDFFRKTVAFMFSQIGVIVLVIGYSLIGAISFMKIELKGNDTNSEKADELKRQYSLNFWQLAKIENMFNETSFVILSNAELKAYQNEVVQLVKNNYDGRTIQSMWTFPASLMFSLSAITMIGYGNIVPRTVWGKICTVIYVVFGIPLYVFYFLNVGKGLSSGLKWIYIWFVKCSSVPDNTHPHKRIIVPSSTCLWVISGYILFGTIMFAQWENWTFLDSSYFCVTSLCKLGFGDFVPGNITTKKGSQVRLIMNYFYMFFGQGLVAMCYHLMSEQVQVKMHEMSEDFRVCLRDTQAKISSYFRKKIRCFR